MLMQPGLEFNWKHPVVPVSVLAVLTGLYLVTYKSKMFTNPIS